MKDQMERFVVLPFSFGCSSQSSVLVGTTSQPKKAKSKPNQPAVTRKHEGEANPSKKMIMKSYFKFLGLSKASVLSGIKRLIRNIRSFSESLVYKDDEMEEMEIGFPTDVKHLTHIGLDGNHATCSNNNIKGWENLTAPEMTMSLPSISLRHFELSLAAQANGSLLFDPSKSSLSGTD